MPDGHWIDTYDREVWIKDGKYHRDDGPAVIYCDGSKEWFQHGVYHRADGPASIFKDGTKHWGLNGTDYSFERWLDVNNEITDGKKLFLKLKYG